MTDRDKKIIEDSEAAGIPIFVITAKDILSVESLTDYFNNAVIAHCEDDFVEGVELRIEEFATWQKVNPDKVKLPD